MPITINEMKMPNNCEECEFHQSGYPDWCDLSCRCRDVFNPSIRPDWCPLEEAVPVVRCKDCKHRFDGEHVHNCCEQLMEKSGWITEIPVDDNWYCADGERREDVKTD